MDKENKEELKRDCECLAKSQAKACPKTRNVTHPLRYYEFTDDEMKALEECDRESFYHRCLPFSTILATATYAAVKTGLLSKNPHFGALPKVLLSAMVGYVYGKLSYVPDCDVKLRKLPDDSYLGNVMRKYNQINNPPAPAPPLQKK